MPTVPISSRAELYRYLDVSAVPLSGPSTVERFPTASYVRASVALSVPVPLATVVLVTLPAES